MQLTVKIEWSLLTHIVADMAPENQGGSRIAEGGVHKSTEAAKQLRIFPHKARKMSLIRKHYLCISAANRHWLHNIVTDSVAVLELLVSSFHRDFT